MIDLANRTSGKPQPAGRASTARQFSPLTRIVRSVRQNGSLFLMALPGLLLLLAFNYLPMAGLVIAFKDYKPIKGVMASNWSGLHNFKYLFGTEIASRITINTLLLNGVFIITGIIASLLIALLLNEVRVHYLTRVYQSAVFFPFFVSWIVVGYFVFALLNTDSGLINKLLTSLGLNTVDWYSSPKFWPAILTTANLWKNAGYWSVIYLAGMMTISQEYYEAARIDGASRIQQIVYITLPLLLPIIIVNLLLSIGRIFFADFGMFYYVTRNNPLLYPTTDVIDTYVFRALRSLGDYGMASAASFYQSLVGFTLVVAANWAVKRFAPDKSLF